MFLPDKRYPHSNFPKLTNSVKAAECRSLAPAIAELCAQYDLPGGVEWRSRTLCIRNLVRFYDACDGAGVFPTASERARMAKTTKSCLALYSSLARDAANLGKTKWSIVNKFHFWYHLGVDETFVNPRHLWTYQGEDFQRHISAAANSCAVGSSILDVPNKLVEKVRAGKHTERYAVAADPRPDMSCIAYDVCSGGWLVG